MFIMITSLFPMYGEVSNDLHVDQTDEKTIITGLRRPIIDGIDTLSNQDTEQLGEWADAKSFNIDLHGSNDLTIPTNIRMKRDRKSVV